MKMNKMSERTTQSWRHAVLNHTSPFSPFFPLALALPGKANGHEATGEKVERYKQTPKLQKMFCHLPPA